MKTLFFFKKAILLTAVVFVIKGCSENDDLVSHGFDRSWKVVYYMQNGVKVTKENLPTWLDYNKGDITASFTAPGSDGKGSVSGIKVTNTYSGNYTLGTDGTLTIDSVVSTEINEPDWTSLYHLSGTKTFEIKGSNLFLSDMDEDLFIVFEPN